MRRHGTTADTKDARQHDQVRARDGWTKRMREEGQRHKDEADRIGKAHNLRYRHGKDWHDFDSEFWDELPFTD